MTPRQTISIDELKDRLLDKLHLIIQRFDQTGSYVMRSTFQRAVRVTFCECR